MRNLFVAAALLVGCSGSGGDAFDGSNGADGKDGKDGLNGADGKPGEQGPPGPAGEPGSEAQTSGSRLKAQWLAGEDGSRQFSAFYDTTLQARCFFQQVTPGDWRCVSQPADIGGSAVFSNPTCTNAVAISYGSDCAPTPAPHAYVPAYVSYDACKGFTVKTYAVGAAIAKPAKVYAINTISGCVEMMSAPHPASKYYQTGAEFVAIDPSEFVGATLETDP